MAKTILEELEALVGKDAADKIKAKSDIATKLVEGERLYRFYTGDEELEDDTGTRAAAERAAAEKAAAEAKAAADAAAAARAMTTTTTTPAATSTSAPVDTKALLAELSTMLDARLKALTEKVVTTDKLPESEGKLLTRTLKLSLEMAQIESTHEKEFGEQLDLDKFNGWYEEQRKAGSSYGSVPQAYNAYVAERRIDAKIKAGIAEGLKAKASSTAVPAQTTSQALAPAQQILRDARKPTATEGKSNAVKAAERLAALQQERESAGAV